MSANSGVKLSKVINTIEVAFEPTYSTQQDMQLMQYIRLVLLQVISVIMGYFFNVRHKYNFIYIFPHINCHHCRCLLRTTVSDRYTHIIVIVAGCSELQCQTQILVYIYISPHCRHCRCLPRTTMSDRYTHIVVIVAGCSELQCQTQI